MARTWFVFLSLKRAPALSKGLLSTLLSTMIAFVLLQFAWELSLPLPNQSVVASTKFSLPTPPNSDAPRGRRKGGAGRCANCGTSDLQLTALVPGKDSESFVTLTTAEYPTFWFYIPSPLSDQELVEFVLQDEQDEVIYQVNFKQLGLAGIVNIAVPRQDAKKPLTIGQRYRWTFVIYEEPKTTKYQTVDGFIQRVALERRSIDQIALLAPQERAVLYAKKEIWHDAIAEIAELHQAHPNNQVVSSDWNSLLQVLGLANIATQPLGNIATQHLVVECCRSK